MFTCSRCGELVTCPYFYQGGVYGYTCIDIVTGGKRRKHSLKLQELSIVSIETHDSVRYAGQKRVKVVFHPLGFINKKACTWLEFSQDSGFFCDGRYFLIDNKLYQSI